MLRILRTYIVLISLWVLVLLSGLTWFQVDSEARLQRDLLLTRLTNHWALVHQPAHAWSQEPAVRAALRESVTRDATLAAGLARLNEGPHRTVLLLDRLGQPVLTPDAAADSPLPRLPSVLAAVASPGPRLGVQASPAGVLALVGVIPVGAPVGGDPAGFLVLSVDLPGLLPEGTRPGDLTLALAVGDESPQPALPVAVALNVSAAKPLMIGNQPQQVRLWVSQPIHHALGVIGLAVLVLIGLGVWALRRVEGWTLGFATTTTRRYAELLEESQRLVAGRDGARGQSPGPRLPVARDELSELAQALADLIRQQKHLIDDLQKTAQVFAAAAEGIVVTDRAGRIVDVNPAFMAITGYRREELVGRLATGVYRWVAGEAARNSGKWSIGEGGRSSGEIRFLARGDRWVTATLSISRIRDAQGMGQGYVTVLTDVSALKEAQNALQAMAFADDLTGLPTFSRVSEQARDQLRRAIPATQAYAVLFLDMDRLKFVNDSYGHHVGDLALKALGRHLGRALPRGHQLCRRSGDEFVALVDLPAGSGEAELGASLERLNPITVDLPPVGTLTLTVTAGVSRYPQDGHDWDHLLQCANTALNEAKQRQRGSVVWFEPVLGQRAHRQRILHGSLVRAIESRAVQVYYQPEVHLETGQVVGFEALARWTDSALGPVKPAEFIAAAEEGRLIEALSLQVLQTVLWDKPRLQSRFPGMRLGVNISPRALLGMRLVEYLNVRARAHAPLLDGLDIELTETQLASTEAELLEKLYALNALGLRVVIDDFGTGYSSLSRLTQFPISRLKIDRSFVATLKQRRPSKLAQLVVNLGQVMGLEVTAEGVETETQRRLLLEIGCRRAQGWLFAPALPLDEALSLPRQFTLPRA